MILMVAQTGAGWFADVHGDWVNQRGTAIVRIADCASGLCGTIVWSAMEAEQDAARAGVRELEGTTVMSGFAPSPGGRWRGKLFLPDQNRTVKATIELRGDELRVTGCELGGLLCKSQNWSRRPKE